jgi:hypothetical protein
MDNPNVFNGWLLLVQLMEWAVNVCNRKPKSTMTYGAVGSISPQNEIYESTPCGSEAEQNEHDKFVSTLPANIERESVKSQFWSRSDARILRGTGPLSTRCSPNSRLKVILNAKRGVIPIYHGIGTKKLSALFLKKDCWHFENVWPGFARAELWATTEMHAVDISKIVRRHMKWTGIGTCNSLGLEFTVWRRSFQPHETILLRTQIALT